MSRNQLNIRVSDELEELIDKKRIALATEMKIIPTRSDVVRYALANYLGISLEKTDHDDGDPVETKQVKTKGKRSD